MSIKITILWNEGNQTIKPNHTFESLSDANKWLVRHSMSMRPNSGYDKVKFTAEVDGEKEAYTGRFDIYAHGERQETNSGAICFLEWMKDYISYLITQGNEHAPEFLKKLNNVTYC